MKLEDVVKKLSALRQKRRSESSDATLSTLVEAIVEYTLVEPPRFWYLLEVPEPSPTTTGGWRKVVEIMKRRGYHLSNHQEEEILVNSLAQSYSFSAATKFRAIISALMIKVSREAGILHNWHRILYVTAKHVLDKDLSENFDPLWNEPLELHQSFQELSVPEKVVERDENSGQSTPPAEETQGQCQAPSTAVKRKRKPRVKTVRATQPKTEDYTDGSVYKYEPYWTEAMAGNSEESHFYTDSMCSPGSFDSNLVNVIFI